MCSYLDSEVVLCACVRARSSSSNFRKLFSVIRSVIMSNNNASSSSVAVATKAVKQLRLEAKIRRINVSMSAST